jgi:hypothetical protein
VIPDGHNVYGRIVTLTGLSPVLCAVERLAGAGRAYIDTPQFNEARTLRFSSDDVDFESTPLDGGFHLLNGRVGGTLDDVVAFVRAMSRSFTDEGIEHHFEVYDGDHLALEVPVSLDPSWLTPTVVGLAQAIDADRAFDRLPILADALEDAGCDAADLLAHLRGDGPHARGCWALDLVLGKE